MSKKGLHSAVGIQADNATLNVVASDDICLQHPGSCSPPPSPRPNKPTSEVWATVRLLYYYKAAALQLNESTLQFDADVELGFFYD